MGDRRKQIGLVILIVGSALALMLILGVVATVVLVSVWTRARAPHSVVHSPEFTGGSMTVTGKHVVVHASPMEQRNARFLADLGDAVLESYVRDTESEMPREPISLFLFDHLEDYQRAARSENSGPQFNNPAFSHHGDVYIHFGPRPGETVVDAESRMAHMVAHELCHALHERLYPNYDLQPSWLQEGVADAWAERALNGISGRTAESSLWASTMLQTLRQNMRKADTLSIESIVKQSRARYIDADAAQSYLGYCRSFALVRMLDDPAPANAARHAHFRAFLKEVDRLQGSDIAQQADARFVEEFGGAQREDMQRELIRRILTERLSPWMMAGNEVHVLRDGALLVETEP